MLKRINLKEILFVCLLAIFITFSVKAMFHEGFFRTIDDVTPVRINYMLRELNRGLWWDHFPIRLAGELSHTYGYLIYLFYAPLVYYVGALLMLLGHTSDIMATKAVYAFPLIVGPLLFYWSARQKLGRFPSLVGAIAFALFPYRGFDAYFRGGVGENWAIAFLPAVFGGLFLIEKKNRWGSLIAPVALALAILSHNISALLATGSAVLYGLIFIRPLKRLLAPILLGLGLSATLWLPSTYYLPLIRANTYELNTTHIYGTLMPLVDLIKPNFSYQPSQTFTPIFFYLMLAGILVILISKNKHKQEPLFWLSLSLLLYLSMSTPFKFLWQISNPVTRNLQFVWRVLILLSFTLPLALSYLVSLFNKTWLKLLSGLLIIYIFSQFIITFRPKEYSFFYSYSAEDTGPCATAWGDDYLPVWVEKCIDRPPAKVAYLTLPGSLDLTDNKVIRLSGTYNSEQDNTLMVHRYYFPGWHIKIDNSDVPINYTFSPSGIMEAKVPSGSHSFLVYFTKTWIMWLADSISLLSMVIIGWQYVKKVIRK